MHICFIKKTSQISERFFVGLLGIEPIIFLHFFQSLKHKENHENINYYLLLIEHIKLS